MSGDHVIMVLAVVALRRELARIVGDGEDGTTYRFPDDVPAERIADLLDFLWNLLDEVRLLRRGMPPPKGAE